MENAYSTITDKIVTQVCKLVPATGIGTKVRYKGLGLVWLKLKPIVFKLIKAGVIRKKIREDRLESVDENDLNQIEVSIELKSPNKFHRSN